MSHSFDQNTSVLRRWAHHSDTALPADWVSFRQSNQTLAMNIEREDPTLVSLLRGSASASVTADAIEGKLSAKPQSYDDRMKTQHQERMQHLADNNPYAAGNMTGALEVEAANPELAKRLKREAGIGSNGSLAVPPAKIHQLQDAIRAQETRVDAMNHNQERLRRGALA